MLSYNDFQALVCKSAKQYYSYLEEKQEKGAFESGRRVISVYQITPGRIPREYTLAVSDKVIHPDQCEIWIRGKKADGIEMLATQSYNRYTHSIRISDKEGLLDTFEKINPDDIKIVSDFLFLIKRLHDFYRYNSFSLLPPAPVDIPPLPHEFTATLSPEQLDAINAVFTSPVTYISGAPGTGKTKAVLANCVLRYVLAKKRIILLAPTNNAVEQMLRGILPILKDAGINLECVYRIGTASESFAQDYPQVIGDTALESLLDSLLKQKAYYYSQLDQAHVLQNKAQLLHERIADCRAAHREIQIAFLPVQVTMQKILEINREINCIEQTQRDSRHENYLANKEARSVRADLTECGNNISSVASQLNRIKLFFWKKKQRTIFEEQLHSLRLNYSELSSLNDTATARLNQLSQELEGISNKLKCLESERNQLYNQCVPILENIYTLSRCDPDYSNAVSNSIKKHLSLSLAESFIDSLECKYHDVLSQLSEYPIDKLQTEYNSVIQELNNLGSNAKVNQKNNALVLAGTIDSSYKELIDFDDESEDIREKAKKYHVFLDEAGYTCIAKGMAAFSCGAPVTFLGDHKQLPPVCEMSKITPEYAPVCLWALPIAYYPELICGDFRDLFYRCYSHNDEPHFRGINFQALNTSYRFGQSLANILAKYIYTSRFHGVSNTPFEIQIIDAPFIPGPFTRTSQAEANVIRDYLYANPNQDFAILAPYRNQIKLLRRTLPKEYKDNILTVHRSQGCEWDTIIFSVTDSHEPYFTNSKLPIGRSIINTAISRAKCRLVVVCDTKTWSIRQEQMIAELIEVGIQNK